MLFGRKNIEYFIKKVNHEFKNTNIDICISIQTNSTLINEDWCELIDKYKIRFGISFDGTKEENDKNRVYPNGKGTYDDIIKSIKFCQNYKQKINPGLLTVINTESDPVETYNLYKSLGINSADFLLLEANFDKPPKKPEHGKYSNSNTPTGDWLIDLFNVWFYDSNKIHLRHFNKYVYSILGTDIRGDDVGTDYNDVLTIETNGNYESEDALRICGDSFTKTDVNVLSSSVDDALDTKLAKEYYQSHFNLPKKCVICPINETCGGGYFPHRYSSEKGFNNPSVYCNDLLKLIIHVQNKIIDELPNSLVENSNISKLNFNEVLDFFDTTLPNAPNPNYISELESFRK